MYTHSFTLMAGEITLHSSNKESISFMEEEMKQLVSLFNFFDEKSLLSLLNKKRSIPYQEDLAFLLEKSIFFKELSYGKFNVFLGGAILARKKNQKINENGDCSLDIGKETISLIGDGCIDLGGIAKGYIIDKVLELTIKKYGSIDVLIDARGDGVMAGKTPKYIDVENPYQLQETFETIKLSSGSIITSGHNKQQFDEGSHIIGGESDIFTITLISSLKKCYELDALGTYLIQLPSFDVLEKIAFEEYYQDIECLIVLKKGKVLKSAFWDSYK